jgi:hypothetical protein
MLIKSLSNAKRLKRKQQRKRSIEIEKKLKERGDN